MISEINLERLNRAEYINLILMIIYAFKFNYVKFTEIEKDFLKNAIDRNIFEWKEKI